MRRVRQHLEGEDGSGAERKKLHGADVLRGVQPPILRLRRSAVAGVAVRYEVMIPTTRGWICAENTTDPEHAEAVAREIAVNNENSFHQYGTRVERVSEGTSGNGVPTIHRTRKCGFDHEGNRSPAQDDWLLVEVRRETGRTHRSLIEGGLTEEEAKATASEFNENLAVMGVTSHWCEAVPDRSGS